MSVESFICKFCDYTTTCLELLTAHNRYHVKKENISTLQNQSGASTTSGTIPLEFSSNNSGLDLHTACNRFRVKDENVSSIQSRSQASMSRNTNEFSHSNSSLDLHTAHKRFHVNEVNLPSVQNQSRASITLGTIPNNSKHQSLTHVKQESNFTEVVEAESTLETNMSMMQDALDQKPLDASNPNKPSSSLGLNANSFSGEKSCDFERSTYFNRSFNESNKAQVDHMRSHIKQDDQDFKFEKFCTYRKTQPYLRCEPCCLSFTTYKEHKEHFFALHCNKYICCGINFKKLKKLFLHIKTHHKERCVNCDVCGKGFVRNKDLKKHYRIHLGENRRGWYEAPLAIVKEDSE